MANRNEAERLITTYEAAKILCCSIAWLERQRWKGEPPIHIRVGGANGRMVRYRIADLDAWIADNRIHSTSGQAT